MEEADLETDKGTCLRIDVAFPHKLRGGNTAILLLNHYLNLRDFFDDLYYPDKVADQNPKARVEGSSDPSMILYRNKLIEKVGLIEGGSEVFNRIGHPPQSILHNTLSRPRRPHIFLFIRNILKGKKSNRLYEFSLPIILSYVEKDLYLFSGYIKLLEMSNSNLNLL